MAVASLLCSARSAAQTDSVDDYALAPLQAGSMLSVWGTNPLASGRYAVGLGMHVRPPPVGDEASSTTGEAAGAVSAVELLATLGLWWRTDISAGITAHSGNLDESRDGAARQTALGDLRVIPRLRLVGADSGFGLAVALPAWVPAGNASIYREQGVRLEPRLLASHYGGRVTLSANTGYLFRRLHEGLRTASRGAITAGIGADVLVFDSWSVVTELSTRWQIQTGKGEAGPGPPLEGRTAVRFSAANWMVQLGGGLGLRDAAAQPDWRLLAAVGFTMPEFRHQAPAAPPRDRDGDSIPDRSDPCPDEAAVRGASDVEGCPLEPSEPVAAAPAAQKEEASELPSAEYPVEVAIADAPLPRIEEVLYFDLNEMSVAPAQLAVLDSVEARLRSAPVGTRLVIEGHSDSSGPASFNSSLSRMRASTVRLHLIRRGIPWKSLLIAARGSSRPVELDIDERGRAGNRRVAFRLIRGRAP